MPNPVLESLHDERERQLDVVDQLCARAQEEERDLVDAELELVTRSRDRITALDRQIAPLTELDAMRAASGETRGRLSRSQPPAPQTPDAPAAVYTTFAQYARDVMITRFDPVAAMVPGGRATAQERLTRAVANTLTTDVPGLLPPQHLAQILQVIDSNRPFVNATRRVALQSGKLTYPWITSRPSVSEQVTEKTETTSTKMTVQMNEILAKSYLGAGDLSWQTINWTTPDALQLWFDLAAEAYAKATEQETAGNLQGMTGTTTVGGDTFADWYAALAAAAGLVFSRTGAVADTIYADVATGFKLAGMASTALPVFNAAGNVNLSTGQGTVGGLRLVVSPMAISPLVVVGSSRYIITAETPGAPVELRAVEPAIGGMEVGVIGAFACSIVDASAFEKLVPPVGTATAGGGTTPRAGK